MISARRKLILSLLLCCTEVFLHTFAAPAASKAEPVKLVVNGKAIATEISPLVIEGVTLLPLRDLATALGVEIHWVSETKTAVLCVNDRCYVVRTTDKESGARIINGKVFLPLRKTASLLGYNVKWDERARAIHITTSPR